MKRITLIFTLIAISVCTFAQIKVDEADMFQKVFLFEKKQVVAGYVHPTESQKAAFWKLWDEYEAKRKENGKVRLELYQEYTAKYTTMTDEQVDTWFKKALEVQTNFDNLIKEYYEKIKEATSTIVAVQFYQAEYFFTNKIRAEILEDIPFLPTDKK
jgi:hypothetical protein